MPDSSPETDENVGEDQDVKTSAESSSAEEPEKSGEGEPEDMLSAVKAALTTKEEAPASKDEDPESDSDASDPKDKDQEGEGDDDDDDFTEEELSRLKEKTRKRIDTLLSERAEYKGELETIRPKAEQFDALTTWINDANLNQQEINLLFDIGKNLKAGNLREALDQMAPVYRGLMQQLGEVLTDDLQAKVDQGLIDVETAKRLAVAESTRTIAENQAKQERERGEQARVQTEQRAHVEAVQGAISTWEKSKSEADPDWNRKQPMVLREIQLAIHQKGYPKTTQAAVEIADVALKAVEKTIRQFAPNRKREVKPDPDVSTSRAEAEPTTMLDAVKRGLAAAKTG